MGHITHLCDAPARNPPQGSWAGRQPRSGGIRWHTAAAVGGESCTAASASGAAPHPLAAIAVVTLQLGRATVVGLPAILIFSRSCAVLTWTRLNSAWLILVAGVIGLLVFRH